MCETRLEDCMLRMSWAIAMHSMVWLVSSGPGLKSQQLMRPPDLHVLQTSTALGSIEHSRGDIAPPVHVLSCSMNQAVLVRQCVQVF
jgi:hypothetical protein